MFFGRDGLFVSSPVADVVETLKVNAGRQPVRSIMRQKLGWNPCSTPDDVDTVGTYMSSILLPTTDERMYRLPRIVARSVNQWLASESIDIS